MCLTCQELILCQILRDLRCTVFLTAERPIARRSDDSMIECVVLKRPGGCRPLESLEVRQLGVP